eukprot:jgi/Chlat1/8278/Chrsp78S07702
MVTMLAELVVPCGQRTAGSPRKATPRFLSLRPPRHALPSLSSAAAVKQQARRPDRLGTVCCTATQPAASASTSRARPGEKKGFVEEMRFVAMKLHTRDQAKEGQQQEHKNPLARWEPSNTGYLQFLVDSKAVYDFLEHTISASSNPMYAKFRSTGLERSKVLEQDLAWFAEQGYELPKAGPAGDEYVKYLSNLAENNPPAFICHFYNVYFAHSAGGRMIGAKVSEMLFKGREFNFYKWEGDLKELLNSVRDNINEVAEGWSREEKDVCLQETEKSFSYSGGILRQILGGAH